MTGPVYPLTPAHPPGVGGTPVGNSKVTMRMPTAGSLSRPRRPLSRGSGPAGYPAQPLVSYRSNRQLSGWNPPPQVIRAFGAHSQEKTIPRSPDPRLRAGQSRPVALSAVRGGPATVRTTSELRPM